jgi:NADPH:quinone reductase
LNFPIKQRGGECIMRAAYYTKLGAARDVLRLGEIDTPAPGAGEIRVRVHVSGVNPSDWKARLRGRGGGLPFPMIIPHSDGAGIIDAVGDGVEARRIGQRVWVMNAQWQRPFGTAAEYVVLPQKTELTWQRLLALAFHSSRRSALSPLTVKSPARRC